MMEAWRGPTTSSIGRVCAASSGNYAAGDALPRPGERDRARARTSAPGSRSPGPTSRPRRATRSRRSSGACEVLARADLDPETEGQGLAAARADPDAHRRERRGPGGLRAGHRGAAAGQRRPRLRPAQPGQRAPAARRSATGRRRLRGGRATSWTSRAASSTAPRPSTTSATPGSSPATWSAPCRRSTQAAAGARPARRRSTAPPCEQDRAEVLTAAGRPHEAVRALEQAATAYGSRRLRTFQAECELTLAWTLLREDPAQARVVARRAARRFRGQASPARALRADAVGPGGRDRRRAAGRRSLLDRADQLAADAARATASRATPTILQLQGGPGQRAPRRPRRRPATGCDASASTGSSPVTTRLLWREVRAELARARGDARHARDHVRAGLADLHAWQSSFGSLDLQSTLVGHGRDLAAAGAAARPRARRPGARLRVVRARPDPRRPGHARAAARPTSRWPSDLTELRVLQTRASPARTPEARRMEELRDRVRQHRWYADGAGEVTEPADARASCRRRSRRTTPRSSPTSWSRPGHRAGRARRTGPTVVDLGPLGPLRDRLDGLTSDLTMAAAHRDDPLAVPLRAALRARLAVVAEQLVAPLRRPARRPPAWCSPRPARLAGTPWSLLPGLVGRPLTIPPSATRWLELRGAPQPAARSGSWPARTWPAGAEEVTRAAAAWRDAHVLGGDDATTTRVAELAESGSTCCTSPGTGGTPGENPLFSAVELVDGPWFGYDIDELRRTPVDGGALGVRARPGLGALRRGGDRDVAPRGCTPARGRCSPPPS